MPTSNASPYGFAFFDRASVKGIDTVYVADDRTPASGGGIQKWSWNGTTWSLAKTFTNGITTGVRGLAAEVVAGKVVVYATTTEATQNKLVKLVDDGSASPAIIDASSTAAANTVYRGVAMAWVPPLLDDVFENDFELSVVAASMSVPIAARENAANAACTSSAIRLRSKRPCRD